MKTETSFLFVFFVLASVALSAHGVSPTWTESQKLTVPDASIQDYFGYSVAIDGDTLVAGARWADDRGVDAGAAYLFEEDQAGTSGWRLIKKLTASDGTAVDNFGWSVAIDGDTVVVGAVFDAHTANENGSAYVFERNQGGPDNWGQVKKLVASDPQSGDHFGDAVAIAGQTIVVGAPFADDACVPVDLTCDSGTVYLFERDQGGVRNWGQSAKLTASDGARRDHFGCH